MNTRELSQILHEIMAPATVRAGVMSLVGGNGGDPGRRPARALRLPAVKYSAAALARGEDLAFGVLALSGAGAIVLAFV